MTEEDLLKRDEKLYKIDTAIDRLSIIASDMSKMIAVHEQRLNQHDKNADLISMLLEKRREEFELKIDQIYAAFQEADDRMIEELKLSRDLSLKQHDSYNNRINDLQK